MRNIFVLLLIAFAAPVVGRDFEDHRAKRELLVRSKRRWVLSTIELQEEMDVEYPYAISKMYNDKIEGKNFRFEISGNFVNEYLSIDPKTGMVYAKKKIDREQHESFHVIFDVYDMNNNEKIDKELSFDVEVKDINDNPPVFTKVPKIVTVKENHPEGMLGVEVSATDKDQKDSRNSTFNITVVSQTPKEPKIQAKRINAIMSHLNFTGCFDYDKAKVYTFVLEAKDEGDPPLSSTATVTLNVIDTNSHRPTFKKKTYELEAEEMKEYDNLLRIEVEDKDSPNTDGWRAKFFIESGNKDGMFEIKTDSKTNEGILSIKKPQNFINTTFINLKIGVENVEALSQCKDGQLITDSAGLPPKEFATITVKIKDDNDPPVFLKTSHTTYEKEESEPGRTIYTAQASDVDSESFKFVLLDDPADWVEIDEKTGKIKTKKKLDRESPFVTKDNTYKFVIGAVDNGEPPASSTCTVTIQVGDINDHSPKLVNSNLLMCAHQKDSLEVLVEDPDGFPFSGPFTFSLKDPKDAKHWKLDPAFGQKAGLVTVSDIAFGNYTVTLNIEDQQGVIGEETLKVTLCECEEGKGCRDKKPLSTAFGLGGLGGILGGLLLFILLLAACVCHSDKPEPLELADEGAQTLITYNEEGGLSPCNAEPSYSSAVSALPTSFEIRNADMATKWGMPSGFMFREEKTTTENMWMHSNENGYGQGTDSYKNGHSRGSMWAKNRTSSYWGGVSMTRRAMSIRAEHRIGGQIEKKLSILEVFEEDAEGNDLTSKPIVYKFEGTGSLCGSLDREPDNVDAHDDLRFLDDLGPQFRKLAEICRQPR